MLKQIVRKFSEDQLIACRSNRPGLPVVLPVLAKSNCPEDGVEEHLEEAKTKLLKIPDGILLARRCKSACKKKSSSKKESSSKKKSITKKSVVKKKSGNEKRRVKGRSRADVASEDEDGEVDGNDDSDESVDPPPVKRPRIISPWKGVKLLPSITKKTLIDLGEDVPIELISDTPGKLEVVLGWTYMECSEGMQIVNRTFKDPQTIRNEIIKECR